MEAAKIRFSGGFSIANFQATDFFMKFPEDMIDQINAAYSKILPSGKSVMKAEYNTEIERLEAKLSHCADSNRSGERGASADIQAGHWVQRK